MSSWGSFAVLLISGAPEPAPVNIAAEAAPSDRFTGSGIAEALGAGVSFVAVITSFYPAATVALAGVVLNERMVRQQILGVAFAALSVTLIAF